MSLDENAVRRALLHLVSLGDTDIFPAPFEYRFYQHQIEDIIKCVLSLDTTNHTPNSAFECLCPKGQLSFRIAHQLFPIDCVLYTAAVIQIAPSIENLKSEADSASFAYRFVDDPTEPRLFANASSYHDWLLYLRSMFTGAGLFSDVRYVLETDISDFYARIYFHRLEHVLDDCGAPNQIRKIIERIIKSTRARQSYGLPVGTAASRVLAEGLLIDTDKMIAAHSTEYSRYVDDFRVVVSHMSEIHSLLCKIAEHLMLTEGLSLNASKTRFYTDAEGIVLVDGKLTEVFSDEDLVRLNKYISAVYADEDVSVEDVEDVDSSNLVHKLKIAIEPGKVDYSAIKVILKVLRAVTIEEPLQFVKSFSELIYHTPRDFCLLVGGLAQRHPSAAVDIAEQLITTIGEEPYRDMALSRIWVAHLFVTQALPITEQIRQKMNLNGTVLEKRQDLILRGLLQDRAFFRSQKTKFNEASDWEKPALMLGASCLSTSEYSTWLDTVKDHMHDPTSDVYIRWLRTNHSHALSLIKEDYIIKTKAEKEAEWQETIKNILSQINLDDS